MRAAAAKPLDEILERDWDRTLFATGRKPGLAVQLGWESHWTFLSKGSKAGFPDRELWRERVIHVELKREPRVATPLTDEQRHVLDGLARAGAECYLWRPSDLDEIARILSRRWLFYEEGGEVGLGQIGERDRNEQDFWTPRSLWIPGVGRTDTTEQQSLLTTKGAAA